MKKYKLIFTILAVLVAFSIKAQVAINGTGADADATAILDINADDKGVSFPNVDIPVLGEDTPIRDAKIGLVVYNTNTSTGPGLFMWDGSNWISLSQQTSSSPGSFESVSLSSPQTLSNTAWTDIPGTSLTFTAENSRVLINMTASGNITGIIVASSSVRLRVRYFDDSSIIGGTGTQITPQGFTGTPSAEWSVSFSKEITGLTPGTEYEINVEGIGNGTTVYIRPAYDNGSAEHLTLTVIQ